MNDIFDEYGSVILAAVAGIVIIAGGSLLLKSGLLIDWVNNYAQMLGG